MYTLDVIGMVESFCYPYIILKNMQENHRQNLFKNIQSVSDPRALIFAATFLIDLVLNSKP